MQPKNVIIDCDPGMDDSLAIILAVKSAELTIKAITTVAGNYPVAITSKNALKTLELIGAEGIPVARGMSKPLVRELADDPFSHGADGQAENNLPEPGTTLHPKHAVDLIIETVKAHAGAIDIIALAPLTNIAMALLKAPEIKPMIRQITTIAGAYGVTRYATVNATGDTPQSEWNIYVDPEAAKKVFQSGVKINAIGLDVATHFDINFGEAELTALAESSRREAAFLLQMVNFVTGRGFESYCVLIDSLAVAATIDPTIVSTLSARVGVETEGKLTLGMTVMDTRHHHGWDELPDIDIAYQADFPRFLQMIMDAVLK